MPNLIEKRLVVLKLKHADIESLQLCFVFLTFFVKER